MTSRITWMLPAVALVCALVMAVLGLRQFEAQAYGVDRVWAVQAKAVPSEPSASHFARGLQEVAGGDSTIRKVVLDDLNPAEGYALYGTETEFDRHDQRTRDVFDDRQRRLLPMSELPARERSGPWVVTDEEAAHRLQAYLGEAGGSAQIIAFHPVILAPAFLLSGPSMTFVVAVVLLVTGAAGVGAVLGGRRYAIASLQGQSFWRALGDDAGEVLRRGWAPTVGVAIVGVLMVFAAGWSAALLSLAVVTGALWLILLALTVAAHVVGALLGSRSALIDRLKGRLPVVPATLVTLLIRNAALVLAVVAITTAMTQTRLLAEYQQTAALREAVGSRVHVGLGEVLARDFDDPEVKRLGRWVASEVEEGQAMQVAIEDDQTVATGTHDFRPVVVASDGYLDIPGVVEGAGVSLRPPGDEAIVYVPRSHPSRDEVVVRGVRELFQAEQRISRDSGAGSVSLPRISVQRIDDDARWFVPVSARTPERAPWVRNPVVVVWGGPAERISPINWASAASLYNVVFESAGQVRRSGASAGVGEHITSTAQLRSVQNSVAEQVTVDAGTSVASAVLATLAVFLGCAGAAALFFAGTRQRRFAEYIHGWSFARALALPVMADLLLLAGSVLAWRLLHDLGQQGLPPDLRQPGPAPLFLLSLTAVSWMITVVALRLSFERAGRSGAQKGL